MNRYRIIQTAPDQFTIKKKFWFLWVTLLKYYGGETAWWYSRCFKTAEAAKEYLRGRSGKYAAPQGYPFMVEEITA